MQWVTEEMLCILPREWDQFADAARPEPDQSLVDAYYESITILIEGYAKVPLAWCACQEVYVLHDPKHTPSPRFHDPEFSLLFATLVITT